MQSYECYTTDAKHAIQLNLVANLDDVKADHLPMLTLQQFTAKHGEFGFVGNDNDKGVPEAVYIGFETGKEADAIARVVRSLPKGTYLPAHPLSSRAMAMWSLGQYVFDRYKTNNENLSVLCLGDQTMQDVLAETSAVYLARDLINTPANHMGPKALANAVESLAKTYGATYNVCVGDALLDENFPAIYAVGRAAEEAPRLASLTWGNPKHPRIALVGKGVTFDTGGLDLKPSKGMRFMKKDMGGAANAIALASWIMALNLPVCLELLIPAVENAIGAEAYRPGDVITMRNGLTVEIDNTDAEGRMVLADAMVYASEKKPELIIDLATLTGAARIAVGTDITAMFCNDDTVATDVAACAAVMEDPVWRMPLYQDYHRLLKSSIADMSNSGGTGYAGTITAALFLERFVPQNTPWVHFDMMAWNLSSRPGKPEGGEAMGIKALADYLINRFD